MSEGRSSGPWIVIGLAIGGVGCLGGVILIGAFAGAGFFLAARSEVPPPIVEPAIAPSVSTPDAGLPFCPGYEDDRIRLYATLTATRFTLMATDGTSYPMPYEGDAYPWDALRERLVERRHQEPNRRDLLVTTEPGVPPTVPGRVVALAREVGFTEAMVCRERTPEDDLLLGEAPGAVGPSEDIALGDDPSAAAGDPANFGFGGLGLRGAGDDGEDGEGTIGLGNLGTIGDSRRTGSGYGRGAGGLAGRGSRAPRVGVGAIGVRGSLSRDVVRRVVVRHIAEIRFCYEQGLDDEPELAGRVSVRFVISGSGAVVSSSAGSSTLGSPSVESCMSLAVRRWTFPEPEGGGIVAVTVPFSLSSASE